MIRSISKWANLAAVTEAAAVGAFLVTAPLHPRSSDKHFGMMAVFPGMLLLLLALLIYVLGKFLQSRGRWGSYVQFIMAVLAFFALTIQILR